MNRNETQQTGLVHVGNDTPMTATREGVKEARCRAGAVGPRTSCDVDLPLGLGLGSYQATTTALLTHRHTKFHGPEYVFHGNTAILEKAALINTNGTCYCSVMASANVSSHIEFGASASPAPSQPCRSL